MNVKDQLDRGPDPGIGIFFHAVIRSFDVPNGHPSNQGTSLRFLEQRRVRTLAETAVKPRLLLPCSPSFLGFFAIRPRCTGLLSRM